MKVLVAGGTGFIGRRLVTRLIKQGIDVRICSRKISSPIEELDYVEMDLLDESADFHSLVSGCSVIINCAGEIRDKARMKSLHVDAVSRLINASKHMAKASGQPLHWVQLSSVGAYGPNGTGASSERVVTEETNPAPIGTYETTKTQADELVVASEEEGVFSFSILRPSNVYGSGMPNDSLRQWGNIIKKKLFFYIGAPGSIATYVHVDDVVDALILCGFDERARGQVFNISNDCLQERVVEAMAKALNVPSPTLRIPERVMRIIASSFSWIKGFPLSHSRIDALVSRTHYPANKLASFFDYHPARTVEKTITEVLFDEGGTPK